MNQFSYHLRLVEVTLNLYQKMFVCVCISGQF